MSNNTNDMSKKVAYTEQDIISILETLDSLTIKGYDSASKVVTIANILQNNGQRVAVQAPDLKETMDMSEGDINNTVD